jgi:hypothetical protein
LAVEDERAAARAGIDAQAAAGMRQGAPDALMAFERLILSVIGDGCRLLAPGSL